ncbi:MAG TPA: DUF4126 domain-containing protein [Candidatus Krumholzibacteria bacterium]|nr:DUF4126 domain-containing protein [Candidatus Krumholzibacteria bacterium]
MEALVSILLGAGLAAACGFRVFVPFLALSIAAHNGHVPLSSGFEWIGSTPAMIAFASATILEVGAYYVPWLDNALDTLATPVAVLAGVVLTAAVVTDLSPVLRWGVAVIAGAGMAGTVQSATVLTRLKSSVLTGGVANPLVSTGETAGSATTSVLALLLPVVTFVLIVVGLVIVFMTVRRMTRARRTG